MTGKPGNLMKNQMATKPTLEAAAIERKLYSLSRPTQGGDNTETDTRR